MSEQITEDKKLQWHPAFYAGIQIELADEADKLIFENEHQLGTKPMEIDVLIIKKNSELPVSKNIGRIFRKYNVIEYKSPDDYLSIDDFYKVYGYSCFYKADTGLADFVKITEVTISFFCNKYPRKLIRHLRKMRNYQVRCIEKGIYQVIGDVIPIQIVVTKRLNRKENLWLKSLTDEIEEAVTIEELLDSYKENKKNPLYESVMNIIVQANRGKFEEVKGMCSALEELMKDRMEELMKEKMEEFVKEKELEFESKEKAMETKEKAMETKEKAMETKEKAMETREKAVETREKAVEKKLRELEEKEAEKESGAKRVNALTLILSKVGRFDDIVKAAENKDYQTQLFVEFGL